MLIESETNTLGGGHRRTNRPHSSEPSVIRIGKPGPWTRPGIKRMDSDRLQNLNLPELNNFNEFNAAIPGQSLTDSPGNAAWEHPPQFTDVRKALNYTYGQLLTKPHITKLLTLLKHGVPAEAITKTVLFAGFAGGKWTPDVALLMARPTLAMVVALGKAADIKNMKIGLKKRGNEAAIMGARMTLSSTPYRPVPPPSKKSEKLSIMERPENV